MPGTHKGGLKAAKTNKRLYGKSFYRDIGRVGGAMSSGGGFKKYPELAREAGRLGGLKSRRPKQAA